MRNTINTQLSVENNEMLKLLKQEYDVKKIDDALKIVLKEFASAELIERVDKIVKLKRGE